MHKILPSSRVNGAGERSVLWTQGCTLRCQGCFNQETHELTKGIRYVPRRLAETIASFRQPGLTLSGGEPLDQSEGLAEFITAFRKISEATIFLFTGYTLAEIQADNMKRHVAGMVDAALCGRYIPGMIWENKVLLIVTGRIIPEEVLPLRAVEFVVGKKEKVVTGYPELMLRRRSF